MTASQPADITRKRLFLHKGRAGGDSKLFARLPVEVLTSDATRTLMHIAFRVLVCLAAQYHGVHNGSLSMTRRTARMYGIGNTHTLGAALRELEARGLIRQTRPGSRVPPRSAFYALGWLRIDEPMRDDPHDAMPTLRAADAWLQWTASKQQPHWTVARRISMWRKATWESGARPHGKPKMSGARPPKIAVSSVAQGHCSYISGLGGSAAAGEVRLNGDDYDFDLWEAEGGLLLAGLRGSFNESPLTQWLKLRQSTPTK